MSWSTFFFAGQVHWGWVALALFVGVFFGVLIASLAQMAADTVDSEEADLNAALQ